VGEAVRRSSQEEGVPRRRNFRAPGDQVGDQEREKEAKRKDGPGVKTKKGEPLLDKRSREEDKAQKGAQNVKARGEKRQKTKNKNSPEDTRIGEVRPGGKVGQTGQQQEQPPKRRRPEKCRDPRNSKWAAETVRYPERRTPILQSKSRIQERARNGPP
jgi:hypothetical protein